MVTYEEMGFKITADDGSARAVFEDINLLMEDMAGHMREIIELKNLLRTKQITIGDYFERKGNELDELADLKLQKYLYDIELKRRRENERFNFSWLSLLFTGMAINRMFGQYTKAVEDMLGVNELFNLGMQMLVLNTLEPALPAIYDLLGAFLDFSTGKGPLQSLAGGFIIAATYGGLLLQNLGQLGMAIQGINGLGGAMQKVSLFLATPWVAATLSITLLAAAFVGLYYAIKMALDALKAIYSELKKINDMKIGDVATAANTLNPGYRMATSLGMQPINNLTVNNNGSYNDEFANRRMSDMTVSNISSYLSQQARRALG